MPTSRNKYEEAAAIGVDPEDIAAFDRIAREWVAGRPQDRWLLRRAQADYAVRDIFDPLTPAVYDDVVYCDNQSHGFDIIGGVNDG